MKMNFDMNEKPDFSIVLGGPLFQFLMRMHLTTPALDLLKKRIVIITLFAWLPLLILSIIDGRAWGGGGVPFLLDIEAQSRFLVALPLLIGAELLVHIRLRPIVAQFIERDIISKSDLPHFMQNIDSAITLRNSMLFEAVLLVLVFVGGHLITNEVSILEAFSAGPGSWYAATDNTGIHLSPAGYWYYFISRPLFQFIAFRWYFRLFVWARFLWQTSRLKLNLIPTHPDHAGGLGFLAMSVPAFALLILAHGVLLAGLIANSIFYAGDRLPDFILLIGGIVMLLMLIILGPLLVFTPHLAKARRSGLREYGLLASRYVSAFDFKWIRGGASAGDQLIGSSDIQSLADIVNSFQVVRKIQLFPFNKETVAQLVVFTLIPVLPLVLTMIPLEELIRKVFEVIL